MIESIEVPRSLLLAASQKINDSCRLMLEARNMLPEGSFLHGSIENRLSDMDITLTDALAECEENDLEIENPCPTLWG